MLTADAKSDVRRHLGYGAIAVNRYGTQVGQLANQRINDGLYRLEQRMDSLDLADEAKLSGDCLGELLMVGLNPDLNDSITVVIDSEALENPVSVTLIADRTLTKFEYAGLFAAKLRESAALGAATFQFAGPFQGDLDPNLHPRIEVSAPDPFTITSTFTGVTAFNVARQGVRVDLSAVVGTKFGVDTVKYGYLPILNYLAGAIAGVSKNADLSRAGTYSRGRELQERQRILAFWRHELARFLDVEVVGQVSARMVL